MGIDYTEWHRREIEKAERTHAEHLARHDRSFYGCLAKADRDDDDGGDRNAGGDGGGGASNHALSHLADLAVESQRFSSRAEALNWLISHPNGHAFTRLHKAADQPKDNTMHMSLESILKDYGAIKICKHICDVGKTGYDEHTLVSALTKYAAEQFNMPGDRAFAKLYESEESVRRACNIAKAAEFAVFDIQPVVVGTPDAMHEANDDTEQSAALRAYERLIEIAREKFPFLPADQAFARVFEDKNYAALAAQAHRPPAMTSIYQMPGSAAPGRGAYTKADPAPSTDTAYAELMRKAEEYRNAHPELSVAQCFEKIYTDPANIEISKRERMESAPR